MSALSKLNFGSSRASTLVGLDIQPGYVAAVQARVNGSIVTQRAAGAPLPGDTVREGEVLNLEVLADVLRDLFEDSQLDRRVRIGVANQRAVLRMLELPPVTDRKELAAAVRFQAEDQVPMPLSNAVLDFQSLGVVETANGPRQRVVLVAAQRDMVERLLSAARAAGLKPEGVDLSAFAMIRALYSSETPAEDGRVLYLNVGGLTNMAIAEGTVCQFTRVVSGGLEAMAVEVAERREMSLDQGRQLLSSASLSGEAPRIELVQPPAPESLPSADPAPVAEEHAQAEEVEFHLGRPQASADSQPAAEHEGVYAPPAEVPQTPPAEQPAYDQLADVRLVLENGVREIAGEIRNSLDFHRSQDGGGTVSTVVLSGAALEIDGFAQALQGDLGIPVRCYSVPAANDDGLGGIAPGRLAVAAGLAAEEIHQ
jgi:type IV pilus assembly protein PilM